MKILLAADGSTFTKKALAFLIANANLLAGCELLVLHVQPRLPPRVTAFVGGKAVDDYYRDEAAQVLAPIEEFLKRHAVASTCKWVVGAPADEIVRASQREAAHLIVLGTHGYGLIGRTLMGSVAQSVLGAAEVPVLLVK